MYMLSPLFQLFSDVKLNITNAFQVLLLFFLFVMAFSSTFYLLLDEETVRLAFIKDCTYFSLCILPKEVEV